MIGVVNTWTENISDVGTFTQYSSIPLRPLLKIITAYLIMSSMCTTYSGAVSFRGRGRHIDGPTDGWLVQPYSKEADVH